MVTLLIALQNLDYNRFLDLREKDKVWKLLKADNAPLILSFLKNMFQTEREIPYDAIKANLNMLLSEFASSNPDLQLKVSARDYLNTWMESGWIKRLLQNDVVMLTDAAQKAIDFADNLDAQIISTSATHLENLCNDVQRLYIMVCSDKKLKLKEIDNRIRALKKERELVASEQLEPLSEYQQKEKIKTLYDSSRSLPRDFRKLEEEIIDIDITLRQKIIEDGSSKGDILSMDLDCQEQQMMTDYGAAYKDFFRLICDEALCSKFKKQIDYILDKPISKHLTEKQKSHLHNLIDNLVNESDRVRAVRSRINANLRAFISSEDFEENRRVNELINALEKEAIKFTENKVPIHSKRMAIEMEQGSVRVKSLESLNAGIKSPDKEPDLNIETHVSDGPVSKDVLKLLDTVNIQDVKKSVKKTLGQTSIMTIGQIINSNVIRYGLEEVVAYVRVAKEYNDETVTENEDILIKAKDHTGAVKTLKISLPKIMLSSQMIRNKEEGKYGS